tara:strand:+ start:662 stop:886 length:225 start_codon:yes stop_codon:yes gene_type:complete
MGIKVYTNNTVEVIACGEKIYEKFVNGDVTTGTTPVGAANTGAPLGSRIIKDHYMEPNQFVGLDQNNEWVFSCL